ncbi:MAG: 50S ribosomal protein L4 [Eubacteriales bacterium]
MPKVSVYTKDGKSSGTITLKDEIFAVEINKPVMHQVVVAQLANKRQGTQSALTRAEVRGGGIKPWRQKGTGRARQGSIRSPQWTKGGVVFAPKPRDYKKSVNRKVKRIALKSALSLKAQEENIIVMKDLNLELGKTKEMFEILKNLNVDKKALIVLDGENQNAVRAAANIQNVKTIAANALNVLDILKYEKFIITKDAVKTVEEVYA